MRFHSMKIGGNGRAGSLLDVDGADDALCLMFFLFMGGRLR